MSEKHPGSGDESERERIDRLYDVLSHERRRFVLRSLLDHRTLALADLAELVAERDHDVDFPDVPEEAVLRIYATLHHNHLPKLAEAGLVTYDEEGELVSLSAADQRAHVETLLSVVGPE
ncbi:DUF7344 domain-containing protein [Halomicrobium salinisoli]|uniref:DUF7344 domain-containing protein n=1 Tax=Halomicrobium salinisoli TaxID=2878391 RepID=UPI001CF0C8FC|nr:hypothetical protein [Halomicrobium salinisoli]